MRWKCRDPYCQKPLVLKCIHHAFGINTTHSDGGIISVSDEISYEYFSVDLGDLMALADVVLKVGNLYDKFNTWF